jgi:hypothetical protein
MNETFPEISSSYLQESFSFFNRTRARPRPRPLLLPGRIYNKLVNAYGTRSRASDVARDNGRDLLLHAEGARPMSTINRTRTPGARDHTPAASRNSISFSGVC